MSSIFRGINRALLTSTRSMSILSRSMSTYKMKEGASYIIRAAGPQDYKSVIDMKMEELSKKTPPYMPDKNSLNKALFDRCHGEDCHFFVAVGTSSVEEKLYGAVGVQLRCNVPKDSDSLPIEEEWHSDLEADAYVDFILVPDWARRNGVGTNLFECAKRLAISKGMTRIFMHGAGKTV